MAEKNSTLQQNSRYVVGGSTEVNALRLEWWERTRFPLDDSDSTYVVEPKARGRLDIIAEVYLDDHSLWWLLAMYNAILDPFSEIVEGRVLRIPSKERVQNLMQGRIGGFASTREVPLMNVTPIV